MKLDELDSGILSELRDNCRITYEEISKKTCSNLNTVASRIKRLEREGFIKGYSTHIDFNLIGFGTSAIVHMMLDNPGSMKREHLVDILSMPETVLAYGMTGSHPFNIVLRSRDFDKLVETVEKIGKNPHVVDILPELVFKEYKAIEEFNPLRKGALPSTTYKKRKRPVDQLDYGILREIRNNANKPMREISAKLSAPISTIKDRMDKMIAEGIIKRFVADIDFSKLGYWGFVGVSIKLKNDRVNDENVMSEILKVPETVALMRVLGQYDLHAGVLIKDADHITDILKKIYSIDGIERTESFMAISVFKSRSQYNPLTEFRMKHEKTGI